jgi:hypothetical protein
MKQVGKNPNELCDCCWFDDGKIHVLPAALEAFALKREEDIQKENEN